MKSAITGFTAAPTHVLCTPKDKFALRFAQRQIKDCTNHGHTVGGVVGVGQRLRQAARRHAQVPLPGAGGTLQTVECSGVRGVMECYHRRVSHRNARVSNDGGGT
jgi:hypothetical protein